MRFLLLLLPLLILSGCVVCVAHAAEPVAHYVIVEGYRLPDPVVTPGATVPMTQSALCATKWGKDVRHVTLSMKKAVCAQYGATSCPGKQWELDHVVSRELGGADAIANLFPQPIGQARLKDRLENLLHRQVCAGTLTLAAAQKEIRTNWWAAYKKRFG